MSVPFVAPNNDVNAESEKRRSFVVPLFSADYDERS